jgi:hypothetical protein
MADLVHADQRDLSVDQQLALRTAAVRLAGEFTGRTREQVRPIRDDLERRVRDLLDQLAVPAR